IQSISPIQNKTKTPQASYQLKDSGWIVWLSMALWIAFAWSMASKKVLTLGGHIETIVAAEILGGELITSLSTPIAPTGFSIVLSNQTSWVQTTVRLDSCLIYE